MANNEVVRQIIEAAGSQLVSVVFIKKDGTERQLTFNPRHKGQVLGTGNPLVDEEAKLNLFRIMDIKLNAWRSFDARRVVRVTTAGQTTELAAA